MRELSTRGFERILIIKPSSPGDIIHALPVLHGLRWRYPAAHLAWLVATPFVNLIEADATLDEIIPFDRKRFGRLARSMTVTGEFMSFVHSLRARRFDLVIDLQGLFRSGLLSYATGAKVRIGFGAARELAWMFYTHKIPRGGPHVHAADRNYAVATMLGFQEVPMDFGITIPTADHDHAARLLNDVGVAAQDAYAVLVVATRWKTKCWPADRFGHLARVIGQQHGMRSVVVGGAADVEAGCVAVAASEGTAANLCGRTTLRQLAALIDRASVVITADSTPMHLAAALDRPLVALFGPTHPRRTGPYGRLTDVRRLDLDCSPCYLRRLSRCRREHACMQGLDVATVADAVSRCLSRSWRGTTQQRASSKP